MKRILSLALLGLLLSAVPASAYDYEPLTYDGFIDGSDAVGVGSPSFNGITKVGFDQATGTVYGTSSEGEGRIYRFDAATRESEPFPELAPNTVLFPQYTDDASGFTVDNSGLETQGLIYAFREFQGSVNVYRPGGAPKTDIAFVAQGDICGDVVGPDGHLWIATYTVGIKEFLPTGQATGKIIVPELGPAENKVEMCDFAIDSQYNFYVPENYQGGFVKKYDSNGVFQYRIGSGAAKVVAVDRRDDSVYVDDQTVVEKYSADGSPLDEFGPPEASTAPCPTVIEEAGECFNGIYGSSGIAVDESTGDVYVANRSFPERIDVFTPAGPGTVAANATTDPPTPTPTTALLRGTLNPDGVATTECKFEWGAGFGNLENEVPCDQGDVFNGTTDESVTGEITGLTVGSVYHARLTVKNANGIVSHGLDRFFVAQGKPVLGKVYVNGLNTDGARLNAEIDPNFGKTTFRFEYGTDENYGTVVPLAEGPVPAGAQQTVGRLIQGLTPGTEYHYRVVATNLAGASPSADHIFRTFPQVPSFVDECENSLSRQQTGAALMPDCRSYELASALDTGGYNVESDLVPGQQPFDGPTVDGRLLYGVHDGGVPNSGNPTNFGVDPYLAVRSDIGWSTKYVGIPADGTPSAAPFASTLLATDEDLEDFAFGGPDICDPCFADETGGVPVRGGDGKLVQGMAGSLSPVAEATPDGLIRAPMSADGTHLVFGSTSQFEPDGNDSTGDVSIYMRDLVAGTTQVVSKTPGGTNLPCLQGAGACHSPGNGNGIAELAIAADGSSVVVAQRMSTDSAGNEYWHPYLHQGSDPETVDLAPGTSTGVLFNGMTADGSMAFYSTRDQLSDDDDDSSADIYVVNIDGSDPVTPELVSVDGDGPSNSDECHPVADWNTVSGGPNCDAVAFGGGGGLASEAGTFYFASPELLDGASGDADQANLYVVEPGEAPKFVATMDTSVGKPGPPPPSRSVAKPEFISGLNTPEALAVNQLTGDLYVAERGNQTVSRFTKTGAPHNFTAGPGALTNVLPGQSLGGTGENGLAVDSHPGSFFEGDLYVTSNSSTVRVYADSGALVGVINGFGEACGVAVDQANGDLYVADYFSGLWRLQPISNSKPSFDENYERTRIRTSSGEVSLRPCQVAADAGDVFGSGYNDGPLLAYQASQFGPSPGPEIYGPAVAFKSTTATLDPSTNELIVNAFGRIDVFGPGNEPKESIAKGEIAGSRGIAVNAENHHIYAVNGSSVVELDYLVHSYEPIDNPAIAHAVKESAARRPGDFQVSSDGRYAAFNSATQITDFDPFGHLEVYRYDTDDDSIICASCAPTNSQATRDAVLPQHGNAMTDDGRVFFSSNEPLVLRDTNGNKDAYEWKDGDVYLISSGTSPFDSSMLSVTASGKDAYFFTREKMAPEDLNGSVMRIYDAREFGGFFHIPAPPQCRASDECHGPGSQAPTPAGVGSRGGTEGNLTTPPQAALQARFRAQGRQVQAQAPQTQEAGGTTMRTFLLTIALTLLLAGSAQANMEVESFTSTSSDAQAGGHPDLSTSFTLAEPGVTESASNIVFDAPQGLFGNPSALLRCTASDFALQQCSSNSQAGLVTIYANHNGNKGELLGTAPLYDLQPGPDQTGLFGVSVPIIGVPIQIPVEVRTESDYGLRFTVSELTQTYPLKQADIVFWGFPASPIHKPERFPKGAPGEPSGCPGATDTTCTSGVEASIPNHPLIDNPTICTGEDLTTKLTVYSYQDPDNPTVVNGTYPETTGCEKEVFKPVISAALTTGETDSASGFDLDLKAPQFFGQSPAPSQLRSAIVTLPPELTINPDAADGQTSCSDALASFGSNEAADCPDSSKIGTFAVTTPALEDELIGSIYIGDPRPDSQYRLFMVANGSGVHAKFLATVRPDPETGQVTIEVLDLPQAPFDDFQLHLFASDRGLLATPTHCTTYEVSGVFIPWNDVLPRVTSDDNFGLNSGPGGEPCPGQVRPFEPRLEAGTSNPAAGAFSSFHLKLDRDDGDQYLGDLNFKMPPGFTGVLRGISYCPEESIAAAARNLGKVEQVRPSCPQSSDVGTSNVAAGPGEHPFHAVGRMYLAGPFKGAPLSLVAVTPAIAGPYDYGVVVVRVALHVDPQTAQVSAVSDTVPSIIGGIPIRMRSIQVHIDKPDFTINPTNCSAFSVDSQGIGDQGTVTDFSSYFNAVNCSTLPFKPSMGTRLIGGRKTTRRSANPTLRFDLRSRPGDANIQSLAVTLPKAFEIDQSHLGNLCSEKELISKECAGRTPIGKATTTTPLLDQPLSGPAYAVSGSGGLPRLAFILNGQVKLVPRADTKTVGGKLQTTVPVVPDAQIGHFQLTVFGGKTGYLQNTRSLCAQQPAIKVAYTAQSGKTYSEKVKIKAACGKKKARAKRHLR